MNTESIKAEFEERFPNKIAEVVDDFGSTTKSDIESFLIEKLAEVNESWKKRIDESITKLLQEYANTPLDKRTNGWNWLLKAHAVLSQTSPDNKPTL